MPIWHTTKRICSHILCYILIHITIWYLVQPCLLIWYVARRPEFIYYCSSVYSETILSWPVKTKETDKYWAGFQTVITLIYTLVVLVAVVYSNTFSSTLYDSDYWSSISVQNGCFNAWTYVWERLKMLILNKLFWNYFSLLIGCTISPIE